MGNLDRPFSKVPPQEIDVDKVRDAIGVNLYAVVTTCRGNCGTMHPGIVFHFADAQGGFMDPIMLVVDDLTKFRDLVNDATEAAIEKAAEQ